MNQNSSSLSALKTTLFFRSYLCLIKHRNQICLSISMAFHVLIYLTLLFNILNFHIDWKSISIKINRFKKSCNCTSTRLHSVFGWVPEKKIFLKVLLVMISGQFLNKSWYFINCTYQTIQIWKQNANMMIGYPAMYMSFGLLYCETPCMHYDVITWTSYQN